jgi:hypothetical protein
MKKFYVFNLALVAAGILALTSCPPPPPEPDTVPPPAAVTQTQPEQKQPKQQKPEEEDPIDKLAKEVFGVSRWKLTASFTISNTGDWERACKLIREPGPYKVENGKYLFIIDGDIGVSGHTYNENPYRPQSPNYYSFNWPMGGIVSNNPNLGSSWHYLPATILITGKGRLYLTSNGNFLCISGQTIVIDGDIILEGRKGNDSPLIMATYANGPAPTRVELRNGTLRGNGSYAVWMNGGEFVMSGGSITGNSNTGVYVTDGEFTFTMSGGTISGNNGKSGGGVSLTRGIFTITGGTINGNTAERGGAVFVTTPGNIRKTGGVWEKNTASNGNTWGHTVYYEEWNDVNGVSKIVANYYCDTPLGESDNLKYDWDIPRNWLPAAKGETRNNWTKK